MVWQVPITAPADYDPSYWELARRYIAQANRTSLSSLMIVSKMPNDKVRCRHGASMPARGACLCWVVPVLLPAATVALCGVMLVGGEQGTRTGVTCVLSVHFVLAPGGTRAD